MKKKCANRAQRRSLVNLRKNLVSSSLYPQHVILKVTLTRIISGGLQTVIIVSLMRNNFSFHFFRLYRTQMTRNGTTLTHG